MGIFESLHRDHAVIQDLLDTLIDQTIDSPDDPEAVEMIALHEDDWPDALFDLRLAILAHDRAEETVFYDALRAIPHRAECADSKTEEHHQVEEVLEELERLSPGRNEWTMKISMLKNLIESHIAEEEATIFAIAEPYIDDGVSERLGANFESLREEIEAARRASLTPLRETAVERTAPHV